MQLTVLTYNTLFAGRDGADDRRAQAQIGLINELKPDVFLMQEAKGFDANGGVWLYALEGAHRNARFPRCRPAHRATRRHLHSRAAAPDKLRGRWRPFPPRPRQLKAALPDTDQQITFVSAHLCPNGAKVRRREAAYLAVQAAPDRLTLLTGDFNSASPHDSEPAGLDALPAHHRVRYLADDLRTADRSALARLGGCRPRLGPIGRADRAHGRLQRYRVCRHALRLPARLAGSGGPCQVLPSHPHARDRHGLGPLSRLGHFRVATMNSRRSDEIAHAGRANRPTQLL